MTGISGADWSLMTPATALCPSRGKRVKGSGAHAVSSPLCTLRRVRVPLLASIAGCLATVLYVAVVMPSGHFADDFAVNIWAAGRTYLDGSSPLPAPTVEAVFPSAASYPPIANVVTLPFALPPVAESRLVWTFMLAGCVFAALKVQGVADWRCYLAAFVSPAVVTGLAWGNVSLLLVLGLAFAWRWRNRPVAAGLAVGLLVALKLFLWPLVPWLWFTGRRRAALISVSAGVVFLLVPWAVIRFDRMTEYPRLLATITDVWGRLSVSLYAVLVNHGTPDLEAQVLLVILALAGIAAIAAARERDATAFTLAVVVALLTTPVVWGHYFALLLVPTAILAPGFSWLWLLPLLSFAQLDIGATTGDFRARALACTVALLTTAAVLLRTANVAPRSIEARQMAQRPEAARL